MSKVMSSISKRAEDGSSQSIEVEQIENGFLITRRTEGKDKKGNWIYDTKKYFSAIDPLEGAEKPLADFFD